MSVSIEINRKQRRELAAKLDGIKRGAPKAMSSAVNRTARQTKTRISTEVRRVITVNKRSADKRIAIKGRATVASPSTTVRIDRDYDAGSAPLITSFKSTRDTRFYAGGKRKGDLKRTRGGTVKAGKGVVTKPRVRGGRQTLKHAFIVTGTGGTTIALSRAKDKRKKGWDRRRGRPRVSTVAMLGPSVLGVYENAGNIKKHLEQNVIPRFLVNNLQSQVSRLLGGK